MPDTLLTDQLKRARGQEWVDLLREVYDELAEDLAEDARAIEKERGKITPVDVAELALRYNLRWKQACKWLGEKGVIPRSTYEKLRRREFKVTEAFEAARERGVNENEKAI